MNAATKRLQPRSGVFSGRVDQGRHPRAPAALAGLGELLRGQHQLHPRGFALRGTARGALLRGRRFLGAGHLSRFRQQSAQVRLERNAVGFDAQGVAIARHRVMLRTVRGVDARSGAVLPHGQPDLLAVQHDAVVRVDLDAHFRLLVSRRTVQRMISILHRKQPQSIDMCVINVTGPQ